MVYTDAGVTATISSTIAGTHGLTKNGPGTLILAADNTYSGGTQINEGVLAIDTGGNSFTMAGAIGGGAITKIGTGTLTFSGTNSHSGTNINGGAVQITSDANLGTARQASPREISRSTVERLNSTATSISTTIAASRSTWATARSTCRDSQTEQLATTPFKAASVDRET